MKQRDKETTMKKCYMVEMEIDYEPSQVKGVFTSLRAALKCYTEELLEIDSKSCSLRLEAWEGTESTLVKYSRSPDLTND
jgi:hypothetical protein